MERVYITGSKGMLGRALAPLFADECEVLATDLPESDIRDRKLIEEEIRDFKPDQVIHLASLTDVDRCQLEPEAARETNALGTRNVALACRKTGAAMTYLSTGMIYNGRKVEPYVESDPPDPINVYGRSKYEGEKAVRELLDRYYIFNTCWLFGGGAEDKKFVARTLKQARDKTELKMVNDTFGSPTYTRDLARALRAVIGTSHYGRFFCVNKGCVNRFQIASEILRIAGIKNCRLIPVSSAEFPLPAPRPRMEALRNQNLEALGFDLMRGWKEALEDYITSTLL
ncbi:MAG: dTDP-4-dehydrorhamnose reductase [Candidatus Krumholzibacteriota bacterium]|nr:dTDP-4-dehydrorhamnose reductase [Candidatus Krumholzibacteriota bacterium]